MKRINKITPPDKSAMKKAQEIWNSIGKPLHSLGLLENTIIKIAGITGNEIIPLDKRCVIVFCADNGVVAEDVTQTDSSVTAVVAEAIANGTSSINRLADVYNADVIPVDIGIVRNIKNKKIINRKISCGTRNIASGASMSREQAVRAIVTGIDLAGECAEKGYKILVTGEMGIGNTTTSAAVASVLLDLPARQVTGRGAGLDDARLEHKINVVDSAVKMNFPDTDDPLDILSKLGGYDIAGMTGLFLGGAIYKIPVIIDGFISAISAALAVKINPLAKEYMLCSHVSKEPAARMILEYIGLKPLITAELALGEGTGGIMLLPLLDGALSVYNSAHRFEELDMERYVDF